MKLSVKHDCITLNHGAGGKAMHQLIEQLFLRAFDNEWLRARNDQACLPALSQRLMMTTDCHVVSPLFFPGGDIGSLAVHGTINDLAMGGAKPLYLSVGFILEEGFPLRDLKKIITSMANASQQANVAIVTGDTKVVERGKGDGVFITTTGVGVLPEYVAMKNIITPGDQVIVSGYIGDHGVAVMSQRENLSFATNIVSDTQALHELTATMLEAVPHLHAMRDPTRGGIAGTLHEWAKQYGVGFQIDEQHIPVCAAVLGACELLGLDPLYVANEGKLLVACAKEDAAPLLNVMRAHPLAKDAAIIGQAVADPQQFVHLRTAFGGSRLVDWLAGDQLPRIC